jgi:hypothetical protein
MATTTRILSVYPCLHKAEQLACRSMAGAYNAGINRNRSVILGIFQTNLPEPQWGTRYLAWRAVYRMSLYNVGTEENPVWVFKPERTWCKTLSDAFNDGTMAQNPVKCFRLAFINSP